MSYLTGRIHAICMLKGLGVHAAAGSEQIILREIDGKRGVGVTRGMGGSWGPEQREAKVTFASRDGGERRDQKNISCLKRTTRGVDTTTGSPRG